MKPVEENKQMTDEQRKIVKSQILEAYDDGQNTYAAYLELCLKTNEAPK